MSSKEEWDFEDLHRIAISSSNIQAAFRDDKHLCSTRTNDHAVEVFQFGVDACENLTKRVFSNAHDLLSYLQNTKHTKTHSINLVFIHQQYTWSALDVSKPMITALMSHYRLTARFLQNLSSFRDRVYPTEEAFSSAVHSIVSDNHFELNYVYKYSEHKSGQIGKPWRTRHTGMCHKYDYENLTSTFIITSPYPNARFAEYLKNCLRDDTTRAMLLASPMLLHSMLLSTHLGSWRDYLEYQERPLIEAEMRAECAVLNEPLVSFETLKRVRAIEKDLLPLEPILESFEKLVFELRKANNKLNDTMEQNDTAVEVFHNALSGFQRECSAYREHAAYLSRRSQSTAQSVSDTLSLYLAQSARDDSIAIKVLTLVASCYLPFSFVATMLGMNLVAFNQDTQNLMVSNQFWLYFALSVPLMGVTLALCKWGLWRHGRGRTSMPIAPGKEDV